MSHLIKVKQPASTRSSKLITLERPSIPSRCKLSNRSFQHAAPQIWNFLQPLFVLLLILHINLLFPMNSFISSWKHFCLISPIHLEPTNCVLYANLPSFRTSPLDWLSEFWLWTVYEPFLLLAYRIGFGFIVLDVVIDDSSTLITMLLLLLLFVHNISFTTVVPKDLIII